MAYNQTVSLERTLSVIGSTSVGKSAICQVFVQKTFPQEYYPTIEKIHRMDEFKSRNGTWYKLTLYDTAGLEKLASIPDKYINSHGFILVYSVADRQSFEIIKEIYEKLKDEANTQNIHIVLIGNKTDLTEQRRVSYEEGVNLVEDWKNSGTIASFIETSAKTGEKVQDVFLTLLELIDCSTSNNTNNTNSTETNNNQTTIKSTKKSSSNNSCTIS